MAKMEYKILDWDSKYFGFTTAIVRISDETAEEIRECITKMSETGVKLAYFFSPRRMEGEVPEFENKLMDEKATLVAPDKQFPIDSVGALAALKRPDRETDISLLEDLALQAGEYSRFSVDSKFPREKFEMLYKTWIRRSIQKEIADSVLIIEKENDPAGIVTLSARAEYGEIGLIAVDRKYRNQRFGKRLVLGALDWCRQNDLKGCRVVTQGKNEAACRLYKKCGFNTQKIEFVYHFWL